MFNHRDRKNLAEHAKLMSVMEHKIPAAHTPVIRAGALAGWQHLVSTLGGNAEILAASQGLTLSQVNNHDAMISYDAFQTLMEHSSAMLGVTDFGLRLGAVQGITMLGPIGLLIASCSTLGESLRLAQHFLRLHAPNEIWALVNQGDCFTLRTLDVQRVQERDFQRRELSLSSANTIIQLLGGKAARPIAVHFSHAALSPVESYRELLGLRPTFCQQFDELVFRKSVLNLPLQSLGVDNLEAIEAQLRDALARQGADTLRQVRWLLSQTQSAANLTIDQVAAMLHMSRRSIQRHLAQQGVTFKQVLKTSRCQAASRLLQSQVKSITAIASAVGYLDSNAFSRAFSQVMGCSPREYQKRYRQATPVAQRAKQ